MALQTFKISDLTETEANSDTDYVEISRDNGNGTFSSFKAPAGGGGGVEVGQALLQIAAQPLGPDYLRLDGATHPKASYPDIAPYFPTASDWGLGGSEDTTANVGTVSSDFAFALSNDASKMYVSKTGSGTIEVYETSGWTLTNTIIINNGWTTEFIPNNIKLSQDGSLLIIGVYTLGETTTEISLIDTSTETVILHLPDSDGTYSSTSEVFHHRFCFNFSGTKILYISRTAPNINVFNISTQSIELTFSNVEYPRSLCFKYDNDYIITSQNDGADSVIKMYDTQGNLVLGPTTITGSYVQTFPNRRTSSYFYITSADFIYKISTSDFSIIDSYAVAGNDRSYVSESGTGEYLAIGSNDSTKGYFFVLHDDTFTLVPGFPNSPSTSLRTHFSKNDLKVAFGFGTAPYFKVANQIGSIDDFVIDDLTQDAPSLTFEYRIKAK